MILLKNIEDKIPIISKLATNTTLNAKLNKMKNEIASITNLATSIVIKAKINNVENKIPNITNLATTALTAVKKYIYNARNLAKNLTITQNY